MDYLMGDRLLKMIEYQENLMSELELSDPLKRGNVKVPLKRFIEYIEWMYANEKRSTVKHINWCEIEKGKLCNCGLMDDLALIGPIHAMEIYPNYENDLDLQFPFRKLMI